MPSIRVQLISFSYLCDKCNDSMRHVQYPPFFRARRNVDSQREAVSIIGLPVYKLGISHLTPFPATYDVFVFFHTQLFTLSVAPITVMAMFNKAESPGQLPLEPAIKDTSGALFYYYASIQNLTLSQRLFLCRSRDLWF